jgi:hypothetical protein
VHAEDLTLIGGMQNVGKTVAVLQMAPNIAGSVRGRATDQPGDKGAEGHSALAPRAGGGRGGNRRGCAAAAACIPGESVAPCPGTGTIGRGGEAAACSVDRQALAFLRSRHKLCRSLGSIVLCRRCFCRCSGQLDVEEDLGENVQQQIEQIRHCGTDQTQASWSEQKDDRKDRPSEEDVAAYPL